MNEANFNQTKVDQLQRGEHIHMVEWDGVHHYIVQEIINLGREIYNLILEEQQHKQIVEIKINNLVESNIYRVNQYH